MLGVFVAGIDPLGHKCQELLRHALERTCAKTSPRFILSSQRVLGNGVRTRINFKAKIPSTGGSEEGRTGDAASRRTASPTLYRLSYSGSLGNAYNCHSRRVPDIHWHVAGTLSYQPKTVKFVSSAGDLGIANWPSYRPTNHLEISTLDATF